MSHRYNTAVPPQEEKSVKLNAMIAAENDEGMRALLLLLSDLNGNVIASTKATEANRTDLSDHLTAYQKHLELTTAYINKGKGIWQLLAWLLPIAQAVLVMVTLNLHQDMRAFSQKLHSIEVTDSINSTRLHNLENRLK